MATAGKLPTTEGQYALNSLPENRRYGKKLKNDEALAMIMSRASLGEQGRDPIHLQLEKNWWTDIAFAAGLQFLNADTAGDSLFKNIPTEDPGYVANHTFRIVRQTIGKMSRAKPDWSVIPDTPDQSDQIGARVGNHFLDHYHDRFKMRKKQRELAVWLVQCGTGYVSTEFNPRAGKRSEVWTNPFSGDIVDPDKMSQEEKQFLVSAGATREINQGDIEVKVISPFQVTIPHVYTKPEDLPWMVIEEVWSLDKLWDFYPKEAPHIQPDELYSGERGQYWRRLSSLVNRFGFTLPSQSGDRNESVTIRKMYQRPSGRFPAGIYIVATASGRLLENGPHPYASVEGLEMLGVENPEKPLDIFFPVVRFVYAEQPGRWWGQGLVEHLIQPQREYNRARAQLANQRDVLSQPQWISPKQAELTSTRAEYGDIWEFDGRFGKPQLVNPPSVSPAQVQTANDALYDLQTISALSEVSQAQVPTGVRSGVAIQLLQEKDNDVIEPTVQDIEEGWEEVGSNLLKLTSRFITEQQAVHVYGEYRQADIKFFSGKDLNGNVRVRVRAGSMRPTSKAGTISLLLDLLQAGGLNAANPKHSRLMLEGMDIGGIDKFFLAEDGHRRRANIENEMFRNPETDRMTGRPAPYPDTNDRDDHQVHLEEHLQFMTTDAYELLPPIRKLAFEAHVSKHEQAISQMVQAQLALQGALKGGGGAGPKEPGQASQPRQAQPTPGPQSQMQ